MARKITTRLRSPRSCETNHSKGKHLDPLDNETSRGLESDGMPKSCLTKEEIQRVVREELEPVIPRLADRVWSRLQDTIKGKKVQPIRSLVKDDDTIQEEVREDLEHSSSQSAERSYGKRQKKDEVRNWQLQFKTGLPICVYTGQKLTIDVELVDANTGNIVKLGPKHSVDVEVVVLKGHSGTDGYDNRTQEGFEKSVVQERRGKPPLINGNLVVNLNGGTGVLDDIWFTDNSSWTRTKTFRLGLRASPKYRENIREAITQPFTVKESKVQPNEKHLTPAPGDEVWRLKNIGRNGLFHNNLSAAKICNVGQFLQLHNTDPERLREILGKKMTKKKWEDLLRHANTCPLNGNRRMFVDNESDNGRQLTDHTADQVHRAADNFSPKQENHEDTIGKASSSFPSQVSERQTENPAPVQHDMAPRTCAPPFGQEAPPANAGSIAEGQNGVTALPPFVQSQNTHFENPTGFLANEVARPASHQPTSANNWNGRINPGDDGITIGGLQTQSYDINFPYAMPSQMENQHVFPHGPTRASISSFQNGHNGVTASPLPEESQNTHFGNPTKFAANDIARPAAHQPTSANKLNGQFSLGDNGITFGGLPTESLNNNSQFAMHSQMIDSRSQTVNEHVYLCGPISASNSSFQNGQNGPAPFASNQPIPANNWSSLISRGDNGITIGGMPAQPHGINLQHAMSSQMANQYVLPSGPTCGSVSSFQYSSTLPVPEGDPAMEGFTEWEIEFISASLETPNPPDVDTFLRPPP